jgi:hypothetical protein
MLINVREERGLFQQLGAFKGPLLKIDHSHSRLAFGQLGSGLTNRKELARSGGLETFIHSHTKNWNYSLQFNLRLTLPAKSP